MSIVLFTVIDLETSGLAPPASIVEIGVTRLYFDTETKQSEIRGPFARLFKPREEMGPEVIAVHHLTDAMLSEYEVCTEDHIRAVLDEDRPNFIVAANASFEQQWLTPEVVGANLDGKPPHWICSVKAAARLYPEADSHSNQATRYRLDLDLPEALAMPPHRAGPDSYVTAEILGRFLSSGVLVRDLVKWTQQPKLLTKCPIGKQWRGKPWAEVDGSFLSWILQQPDMDEDIAYWAEADLNRREAERAA